MSQQSNHVNWCIRKAQKELEECKRLNKRPQHRGLIKTEPNFEEAKRHIEKAEHNLLATEYLKEGKFTDISPSTAFYSMYHCFLAVAAKFGYESKNQTCTISLVEYLKEEGKIDIDGRFFKMFKYKESDGDGSVIEMREDYTYGIKTSADEINVSDLIKSCKELIEQTKKVVYFES